MSIKISNDGNHSHPFIREELGGTFSLHFHDCATFSKSLAESSLDLRYDRNWPSYRLLVMLCLSWSYRNMRLLRWALNKRQSGCLISTLDFSNSAHSDVPLPVFLSISFNRNAPIDVKEANPTHAKRSELRYGRWFPQIFSWFR
jgi:hypothetical protein